MYLNNKRYARSHPKAKAFGVSRAFLLRFNILARLGFDLGGLFFVLLLITFCTFHSYNMIKFVKRVDLHG